MISHILMSPLEMAQHIAQQARQKRLERNWSQKTLSERAGVSLSVIKKFEQTGKISLEALLNLALVLGELDSFSQVFPPKSPEQFLTLDALLKKDTRQRGRK